MIFTEIMAQTAMAFRHATTTPPQPVPTRAPIPAPRVVETLHRGGGNVMRNLVHFFEAVRAITGRLDQVQVDTILRIPAGASHWPASWLAYGLATAWHEARLRPIREIGRGKGRAYGRPGPHRGQIAYGRGLGQLTWPPNYVWADNALGLNGSLIDNYDRALEPDIAARILIIGMERGAFAASRDGKRHSLARHLPGAIGYYPQFVAARRIINGTDRADMIARHAEKFQAAVLAGGWGAA